MTSSLYIAFWVFVGVLFYIYAGYPALLWGISLLRSKRHKLHERGQPSVSLIIAAYNEESVIKEKIENSLQLKYPKEILEIIVFSDASTDRTDEIVRRYADRGVRLLRIEGRKGKTQCQNEAVDSATGEIVVFSDANSMYEPDAISKLCRHFADPRVGGVSGELRYRGRPIVEGERSYWRYEQMIKRLESRVSSVTTTNGAIYAVRRELYTPLPPDIISDFSEPLKIIQQGYRMIYEPEAAAWETTAASSQEEVQRRVRIVAQSLHSLMRDPELLQLLNPFRHGIFAVQLWSHKVLRWFSGLFTVLIFVFNLTLLGRGLLYDGSMAAQALFYLLALWGGLSELILKKQAPRVPHIAYYFCLSSYAMLKGAMRALRGRTVVTWEPKR